MKYFKNIFKSSKGQTLIETALILPIIILLIFGIIEFGRIFSAYIVISNASREGARAAAVLQVTEVINEGTEAEETIVKIDVDTVVDKIKSRTSSLGDVIIYIDGTKIEESTDLGERNSGSDVTVTVEHELDLITPIIPDLLGADPLTLGRSTMMRVE